METPRIVETRDGITFPVEDSKLVAVRPTIKGDSITLKFFPESLDITRFYPVFVDVNPKSPNFTRLFTYNKKIAYVEL